jgi:hypothetical protein
MYPWSLRLHHNTLVHLRRNVWRTATWVVVVTYHRLVWGIRCVVLVKEFLRLLIHLGVLVLQGSQSFHLIVILGLTLIGHGPKIFFSVDPEGPFGLHLEGGLALVIHVGFLEPVHDELLPLTLVISTLHLVHV